MDLSFARRIEPLRDAVPVTLPVDLAVLLVGVATRQAASRTALVQAALAAAAPPADGSFHSATAAAIARWRGA